jgi:hypothetical protein
MRMRIPESFAENTRSVFARYNIVSLDDLKAATKKLDAHLAVPEPEQQAIAPMPEVIN